MLDVPGRVRPYLRRAYSVADAERGGRHRRVPGQDDRRRHGGSRGAARGLAGAPARPARQRVHGRRTCPRGARVGHRGRRHRRRPVPAAPAGARARPASPAISTWAGGTRGELVLPLPLRGPRRRARRSCDRRRLARREGVRDRGPRPAAAAGARYARVFACGPMPMFAALAKVVGPRRVSSRVLDGGRDGLRLRRLPRLRDSRGPRSPSSSRAARARSCRRRRSRGDRAALQSGSSLARDEGRLTGSLVPRRGEGSTRCELMTPLAVRLGPLELRNPITTASGTFGYGLEFTDFVDLSSIGGLCTKGLSLQAPRRQPAAPDLRDPGRDAQRDRPAERGRRSVSVREASAGCGSSAATVIANVWGDLEEDYVTVVEALEGADGIAAVELNISCPNVRAGRDAVRQLAPATRLARGARARRDAPAPDREALAQRSRPRGVGPRGPRGRSRHPLARQHVRRHGDRPGDGAAADLLRHRRAVRARRSSRSPSAWSTRSPGRCPAVPLMGIGGIAELVRRPRVPRGRSDGRPGRHGELQGPRSVGPPRRRSSASTATRRRRRSARSSGAPTASGEVGGRGGGRRVRRLPALPRARLPDARGGPRGRAPFAGRVGWLKIGLEAFVAEGPSLVAEAAASPAARRSSWT